MFIIIVVVIIIIMDIQVTTTVRDCITLANVTAKAGEGIEEGVFTTLGGRLTPPLQMAMGRLPQEQTQNHHVGD